MTSSSPLEAAAKPSENSASRTTRRSRVQRWPWQEARLAATSAPLAPSEAAVEEDVDVGG